VLANSSWTRRHIEAVWRRRDVVLAYPPCDTSALEAVANRREAPGVPAGRAGGPKVLVFSLAQFRPEKNHALQLEAWALLDPELRTRAKLIIAGTARHARDRALVEGATPCGRRARRASRFLSAGLKAKAAEMGLEDSVEFLVSAPRERIMELLGQADVGGGRRSSVCLGARRGIAAVSPRSCSKLDTAKAVGCSSRRASRKKSRNVSF